MKQEVEARRIAEDEERRKKIEAVQQIKFKEVNNDNKFSNPNVNIKIER